MALSLLCLIACSAASALAAPAAIHVPYAFSGPEVGWKHYVLSVNQGLLPPGDQSARLLKIDPATNRIVGSLALPFGPAAGPFGADVHDLVVDHGAAWLTLYWHSELLRIDPARLQITKRIRLRAPASVVAAGGVLWVALQYGRGVERIDPVTGHRLGRVPVGPQRKTTDGPYQLTATRHDIFATLPGSRRVAEIDIRTRRVRYDNVRPALACSTVLPISGGFWVDDTECSNNYYRWSASRRRIVATVNSGLADYGAAVVHGYLYTGEAVCNPSTNSCPTGYLAKRNLETGRQISRRRLAGTVFLPWFVNGWIWVSDAHNILLRRVRPF